MTRESVGALAYNAIRDSIRYDPLEIGHAVTDDMGVHIQECIRIYNKKIDEDEYCVCYVWADDPLIKGVRRRKFFGWPYLPSPRPDQGVFLYNKRKDSLEKRLWILPQAQVMEGLYLAQSVPAELVQMKQWSMAFYDGCFWQFIRKQHDIKMLSETEYLNANREKLIKAGCKQIDSTFADPFDFSKITANQIINTDQPLLK
jgi:hypothetical protein